MSVNSDNQLPYRQGVGMVIINNQYKIFLGRRVDTKIPAWQMPQGGIDLGETPSKAAMREMEEEIGSSNGRIIAETHNCYSYNIPTFLIPKLWNGNYRGQRQKWFLIKYEGDDSGINLDAHEPEFAEWQWADYDSVIDLAVPFKKKLYNAVLNEFEHLIKRDQ